MTVVVGKNDITPKLKQRFGRKVIRDIRFRVGQSPSWPRLMNSSPIEDRLDVNPPLKELMFRRPFPSRERNDIAAFFRYYLPGMGTQISRRFRKLLCTKTVETSECDSLSVSHDATIFLEAVAGGGVACYLRCIITGQSCRGSRPGAKSCA